MTSPEPVVRRPRRRVWIALIACTLVALAGGPHAWAWYHLWAGKVALAKYHPEKARTALDASLAVWPDRPGVRLLASRAARQAGDFGEAERHLRAAQRAAGGTSDEIAFEWALLQAAAGNIWEVDEYLQRRADQDQNVAPLAWEALADGYLRVYRTVDAMACLDHWLQRDPDNARALELRGWTYVTGKGLKRGSDDFRRALELDPSRGQTRWQLALCLLELGGYEEALPLLERVARDRPNDPEVLARLARCQNMLGRGEDGRRILDGVLAKNPQNAAALRTRGQFSLADGKPAEAEDWLRRAAVAAPSDYQTQWLLFQALQQQNRAAEAREQLRVAEDVKDRTERLGELRSRRLGEHPLDPALHYEMGLLLIRTGLPNQGEWWLQSALSLDAEYAPAHAALADLYDRAGKTADAAEHRRKAGP